MKKKQYVIGILCSIVIIILLVVLIFLINNKIENNKSFSLDNFSYYIENFSTDIKMREIKNRKQAKEVASRLIEENYLEGILDYIKLEAYYDAENECYLVISELKKWSLKVDLGTYNGGSNYIIIDKDGNVLAMWVQGK